MAAACGASSCAQTPVTVQAQAQPNAKSAAYAPPIFRGDSANFTVTDTVGAPPAPRVGFNVEADLFLPWNEEPMFNRWNAWGAFEPASVRVRSNVTGGSANSLEVAAGKGNSGGLHAYNLLKDGFWNGATATIFRETNGKFAVVRTAKIVKSDLGGSGRMTNQPDVLTFADNGVAPQEGDEVLLDIATTDLTGKTVRPFEKSDPFDFINLTKKSEGTQTLDGANAAPEGGSTAALKTSFAKAGSIEQKWINNNENWARLNEGVTYVWRGWLKQSGIADGKVKVAAGSFGGQTFDVGSEWKLYQFEFVGQQPKKAAEAISLSVTSAGTLWLDNMAVTQKDLPFDALYPAEKAKMATINPGNVRIWALQNNVGFGVPLDAGLSSGWSAPSMLDGRRIQPNGAVSLHQMLEVCSQVGADPWIIVSTRYTPEEWANLIEYLAGPVTSPYGRKRADWGHPAPWTESFNNISLEAGNEVWNAGFKAQGFNGEPERYGAFAQMMFEAMQGSPYYDAEKFDLVVNGWAAQSGDKGYGAQAAKVAASADSFDLAPYLGGGWDVGGEFAGDTTLEFALSNRRHYADSFEAAAKAARELSVGRAKPLDVRLYESGPGYSLPGPNKPIDEKEQNRGKSLGLALGLALGYFDQVLQAQQLGFGPLSFFYYGKGDYWTTHAVWLGLELLNKRATGSLLKVETTQTVLADLAPTTMQRELGGKTRAREMPAVKDAPAVQLHAFRDGDKFALVMLSLRPDGVTPVSVKLPFAPDGEVTVETLSGASLSSNNIKSNEATVKTATQKIGRDFGYQLPAHSLVVVSGTVAG